MRSKGVQLSFHNRRVIPFSFVSLIFVPTSFLVPRFISFRFISVLFLVHSYSSFYNKQLYLFFRVRMLYM